MTLKNLKNTVVHLPTEEECKEYLALVGKAGWKWIDGTKAKNFKLFFEYGKDTCIDAKNIMGFCSKSWHEKRGCKIITLKDFKSMQNIEKTWDNLAKGDVIVDECGNEMAVLTSLDRNYLMSANNMFEYARRWFTLSELKRDYTIKQPIQPEEVTEMTVAECAEKLGVKNLKIVK